MENYFDIVAKDWDDKPSNIERTYAIAKELAMVFAKKKYETALEYGAGTGLLSVLLKNHFSSITLMDNSIQMLCTTIEKLADADIHHIKPQFFDLEHHVYQTKKFDAIYTQMALHHIVDVDLIITKFYNLINKNGMLAIVDLYEEDGSFHDREFSGHLGFNPEYLSKLLFSKGFSNVHYKQCFVINKKDNNDKENSYPIFLLTGYKK